MQRRKISTRSKSNDNRSKKGKDADGDAGDTSAVELVSAENINLNKENPEPASISDCGEEPKDTTQVAKEDVEGWEVLQETVRPPSPVQLEHVVGDFTNAILGADNAEHIERDTLPFTFAEPEPQGRTHESVMTVQLHQHQVVSVDESPVTDLSIVLPSSSKKDVADSIQSASDVSKDEVVDSELGEKFPSNVINGDESRSDDDDDSDGFEDLPLLEPVPNFISKHREGLDYIHKYAETRGQLDRLPCSDDPRVPDRDLLVLLREPSLAGTYVDLPLVPPVTNYIQYGRNSTDVPYRGISYNNFIRDASPQVVHFLLQAIRFKCYSTEAANISRCNPYCSDLRFEVLHGDMSYQPNEYLTWKHEPLLCVSPVIVALSNLTEPRTITGVSEQYVIKDVRVQFLKHEYERMISFLGTVAGCRTIHINGVATGDLFIGISTRFTKMRTMKDRHDPSIPPDDYESPQAACDGFGLLYPPMSTNMRKYRR